MPHGDVTHLEIPVSDLAAATDFYSRVFGWQIAECPATRLPDVAGPNKIGGALTERQEGFTQPRSVIESIPSTRHWPGRPNWAARS